MKSPYEGELVRLRAREDTDLDVMYRWINDWETVQYIASRYPQSRKFEREWLASGDPAFGEAAFIVETLEEQRPIGWLGLHRMAPEHREAHLGVAIGEAEYRDGGYGTDLMRTVSRVAFDVMNLNRIELTVYDWNLRAIRVYEKVGYRREGLLRDGMFRAGKWHNLVLMGLLRGEEL
ncbi:MAG TPA: GNAT family protein [Tepidiformaceae bacterium]|nr:GNAT family protein [Tepidiformaceae bacterium]